MGRMELSDFPTLTRADAETVLGTGNNPSNGNSQGVQVAIARPMLLGESPFWHPTERCLYGCDIAARQVWRWSPDHDEFTAWDFATEPGCVAPIEGGGLLVALRDGIWRFDPASGERTQLVAAPFDTATERFNDGKCDAQGRLWVGTVYEPRQPALAALYCWNGRELRRQADGITVSNGLAWSPDGLTMYWSDTTSHTIFAFDHDPETGVISQQRVWALFALKADAAPASYGGRPDGAAVDVEGCYWVALFEGQRLLRLSPNGEVLREVRLPVRCPTMPCFGGDDLQTLYITTARHNRPETELATQPLAGCVLSVRVDVPGLPVNFAKLRPA
jgi:sugar lactone lactonase YvrE